MLLCVPTNGMSTLEAFQTRFYVVERIFTVSPFIFLYFASTTAVIVCWALKAAKVLVTYIQYCARMHPLGTQAEN